MATFHQPVIPGQGMNQFSSGPMQPSLQTRSYWDDQDYRTTNVNPNPYNYGAGRFEDDPDVSSSVDINEARSLHTQAYQYRELQGLSPPELGHAAAYQAYCMLNEGPPRRGGSEHEREALIGLAVAEASRLMQQSRRNQNIDACTTASGAAARTASRIFAQTRGEFDDERRSRPLYQQNHYAEPDMSQDDDDEWGHPRRVLPRRGRSLSRTRGPTFMDTPSMGPDATPGYRSIPGPPPPIDGMYGGITNSATGPRYPPTPYPSGAHSPALYPRAATSNAVVPQIYQAPGSARSYPGNTALTPYTRSRSASFSYPQTTYPAQPFQTNYVNAPYAYPAYTPQPEPAIFIQAPPRKHRHKHRHRHRSKSR
ncbi:hypothetical protein P691DRAFT_808281 [Macrolepiota fuliginosa MF-IS2]|uniref:Uncharacterized protein n=1 Tax=Macrolepiota fuliginosa MF-IS2 TaxID=1400762 RepID=A0A9P5XI01_9AGAR|nr:hypothetical protein P691DRAFT_808281 [Macrolepiota fuliginosa MF-IS2]